MSEAFIEELIFVHRFADPFFLHKLSMDGLLDATAESNDVLKYLRTLERKWLRPQLKRRVLYPQALALLHRINESPSFRFELRNPEFIVSLVDTLRVDIHYRGRVGQ